MDKIKKDLLKKRAKEIVGREFFQEIMAQDILNEVKAVQPITQVIVGGVDIQVWKDGNKYKIVKEVLPHAKTAEKDSVESMTKEAAIKKITEFLTKAFDVKN